MSFRLAEYDALIGSLGPRKRMAVIDFLESETGERGNTVILRHDVDRLAWRAAAMARLEADRGVRSTYYFRSTPNGNFPWRTLEEIGRLGHEIGYHYECLSACDGDRAAALLQFERNLAILRRVSACRTVAMHGAPLSRHRNQDLLMGIDLAAYGLIGDASLSFARLPLAYFTDTGGRWDADNATNFRDRVGIMAAHVPTPNDPGFGAWLADFQGPVYISTHPERWPSSAAGLLQATLADGAINLAKRALASRRRPVA
jgi:hypothetical protein